MITNKSPRLRWNLPVVFMCLASLTASFALSAKETKSLVLGVHPYLPEKEVIARFTPLADFLGQQLGVKVSLRVGKDYDSHIENVGNNVVDIAYVGPAPYVTLVQRYGKRPLLGRLEINGDPHFKGVIIAKTDSGISSPRDLLGKRFAFGSSHSTMGYLVPRFILKEEGVDLDHLADYQFLGNHRNVALGVLVGDFDAGAVKPEVFEELKHKGLITIATSPPISEHLFVTRKDMPESQVKRLRELLFSLAKTEHGRDILKAIKSSVTGIVPVRHSDYANLEKIMALDTKKPTNR